jgi:hypothetical protein
MRTQVDHALRAAYSVGERKLLATNAAVAAFAAVSNGGGLAVAVSRASPELSEIQAQAAFALSLAGVVVISAIAGLIRWIRLDRVLAIQSVALCLSAVALSLWALQLLLTGVPEEGFVWMPGIFTAWAAYAAVLGVRFLARGSAGLYYLPAFVLLLAGGLDLGVLARAL